MAAKRASRRTGRAKGAEAGNRGGAGTPRLLSGGNPQIAKGHGDAPIRAYIAAVPGWKQAIVRRVDRIITREVPGVRKAVKWNSPLYGAPAGAGEEGAGAECWFMSVHCFDRYVKVAFFQGASLVPPPPGASKQPGVRYLDIHGPAAVGARAGGAVSTGGFDESRFADWVCQAARLPGVKM